MKPNTIFIILHISVSTYIVIFRMIFDIVGHNEPEYYPIEIISTIAIILTTVLAYLIYYENKKRTDLPERLYLALFIVFFAYLMAENNWLPGRETLVGTAIFAILSFTVFVFTLKRMYAIKKPVFWLFLSGIISLMIGTYFDVTFENEGLSSLRLIDRNAFSFSRVLFEEVPELFASLFFLHSIFLLYLHSIREKCSFVITRTAGAIIVISAIIAGYGNSFLLEDHGKPVPLIRIIIGVTLWATGVLITLVYLRYFNSNEKVEAARQ